MFLTASHARAQKQSGGIRGAQPSPFANPIYVCITGSERVHMGSAFVQGVFCLLLLPGWVLFLLFEPPLAVHSPAGLPGLHLQSSWSGGGG